MKKIKSLIPALATISALPAILPLTGCNNSSSSSETDHMVEPTQKQKEPTIDEGSTIATYKFTFKETVTKSTLSVKIEDETLTNDSTVKVDSYTCSGKSCSVKVALTGDTQTKKINCSFTLAFVSTKGWTNKVKGCKFTYTPGLDKELLKKCIGASCVTDCNITLSSEETEPANLSYSKDGKTWTNFAKGTAVAFTKGDFVYLKGNNPHGFSYIDQDEVKHTNTIKITDGQMSLAGNIVGLIDDAAGTTPDLHAYCFYKLFEESTAITSIKGLTLATSVSKNIYSSMFKGCTGLKSLPENLFKATDLSAGEYCYVAMFMNCTGLTALPQDIFSATILSKGCYKNMFNGCTALKTAAPLPVKTLTKNCYYGLFKGCTALTAAPALPATTLTKECYTNMFQGCTSLVNAPALPSTTLAQQCYTNMFNGCTALTVAPELPATAVLAGSYYRMFYGCTNLNKIKVKFTTWPGDTYAVKEWIKNVAASGEFICPQALEEKFGESAIPTGWTVIHQQLI